MNTKIVVPGSKSEIVRTIILSSICGGTIYGASYSLDAEAACNLARSLGANLEWNNDRIRIYSTDNINLNTDVYSSATVYKIAIISMLSKFGEAYINMDEQLANRNLGQLLSFLKKYNIECYFNNGNVYCKGYLSADEYIIADDNSSQLLTALLIGFAVRKTSGIVHYTNIPSFKYVLLTIEILKQFNVKVVVDQNIIYIDARNIRSCNCYIHSDASSLAPWLVAKVLGYKFDISYNIDKLQPDSIFLDILYRMGFCDRSMNFYENAIFNGIDIDCDGFPDIVPFIALACTQVNQISVLRNLNRLIHKESNRLLTTVSILSSLGANIEIIGNDFIINGKKERWEGGNQLYTGDDHRMAMMAAIASLNCKNHNIIMNMESVNKSYPHFWQDFNLIGGEKYVHME